jgi:glutathione S-transferase
MTDPEVTLVGRSSSHFTRTARIFALELAVPHAFRPVLDMTTPDPAAYADNPALKVPILLDGQGPLYGTDNICRELTRRSGQRDRVVLRGDVADRVVANAEEMILHAMSAGVGIITASLAGQSQTAPPKVRRSLDNAVAFLETHVDGVLAALPPERALSFCETSLFCLVTHLPFRKLMDVSGHQRLQAFCQVFGRRPGAQATEYRFDAPPPE